MKKNSFFLVNFELKYFLDWSLFLVQSWRHSCSHCSWFWPVSALNVELCLLLSNVLFGLGRICWQMGLSVWRYESNLPGSYALGTSLPRYRESFVPGIEKPVEDYWQGNTWTCSSHVTWFGLTGPTVSTADHSHLILSISLWLTFKMELPRGPGRLSSSLKGLWWNRSLSSCY